MWAMDNEIVITVTSDNDTRSGFDSARKDAEKFRTDVEKIGISAGDSAGKGVASSFAKGISGIAAAVGGQAAELGAKLSTAAQSAGPYVTGTLVAAAVAAAPLMGAAVAGGIIGGAGAGGVIGAFAVVKEDARVNAAITGMGDKIKTNLQNASGPFISTTLSGLKQIEGAIGTIDFKRIFSSASANAPALFDDVSGAIVRIGDSFEELSSVSGPVLDQIGDGINKVGVAVEMGMGLLADNADEGASALAYLFDVVSGGIVVFFRFVDIMTETWGWIANVGAELGILDEQYADIANGTDAAASSASGLNLKFEEQTQAADDTRTALQQLNDQLRAQTDPAFALLDAQDDLTTAQKEYNAAVKKYGEDSPQAEKALRDAARATGVLSDAVSDTSLTVDGKLSPALRQMYRNAGWSEEKIDALERQLRQAKRAADNWEGTFQQRYVVKYSYQGRQSPVGGGYQNSPSYGADRAMGGVTGAASGGVRSDAVWVGEQGPELVDLPAGTTVHTAADSQRMMRQAYSGGGGAQEVILSVKPGASRDLLDSLLEALRYECRTQYGGSAQRMVGQPEVMV